MVRVTNAVAGHRRKKRLLKKAKGFVGDRKNHLRLTTCAVMSAMAFNYRHRKIKKRDFRRLWTVRLSVAAKINGISYSKDRKSTRLNSSHSQQSRMPSSA